MDRSAQARAFVLCLGVALFTASCRPGNRADGTRGQVAVEAGGSEQAAPTSVDTPARALIPVPPAAIAEAIGTRLANAGAEALDADVWQRVQAFYGDRANAPAWVVQGDIRTRARALMTALDSLPSHGMRTDVYPIEELAAALAPTDSSVGAESWTAESLARADILLTGTAAMYVADMLRGQVDPQELETAWHIPRQDQYLGRSLKRVLTAQQLGDALGSVAPGDDDYGALRRALDRYRKLADNGGWPAIPKGPTLRPGDSTTLVSVLRARLMATAPLREGQTETGTVTATGDSVSIPGRYNTELAGAVARFQQRHGLAPDSAVGPRTRAALNVSASDRATQIMANLERYRWLPSELGGRHIIVNIPAFRLDAYDGDKKILTMRVVVGDELADRRTPVFSDSMSYVQFGPYWNVPRSIAVSEILPKVRQDRGYLAANNYEMVRGWGDEAPVVDASALADAELSSRKYRIRQRPGPDNALGRVKFIFPNDFNIYLHDTPAQALFDKQQRAYSHGCVRVSDPEALAGYVLANQPQWNSSRIAAAIQAGQRTRVNLDQKLPVYLIYLTAFADGGDVVFREDLYDRDDALQARFQSVLTNQATELLLQKVLTMLE